MSFIFSRALVEASLQVSSLAVDAYAPLSLIPTPKPSSLLAKTTAPFLRSRFGMTFEPLTGRLGAGLLTLWLAGFHAKTSAQPGRVPASTASEADSGRKWQGSFAKYDRERSSWRTPQCSLLGDSDEFSETWPRWGSMRNGVSYLRPTPALPICESASGLWPTPTVHGNYNRKGASKSSGDGLATAVRMYPTPCAIDAGTGRINKSRSPGAAERPTLAMMARKNLWPIPCKSASGELDSGQLNPEWVEWLMGWPIGHTALKPLETVRFREWQQQHSPFSLAKEAA